MPKSACRSSSRKLRLSRIAALILPLMLALTMLSQTAFAKTYVITDGDRVVTYTTFATDPAEVLGEAGLALEAYDSFTTQGDTAITINRAETVTIRYYGEEMEAASNGETVGQLLTRLGLETASGDRLSHSLDTAVEDGMVLTIDKVVTRQETYTRNVPHEVSRCDDATLPEGIEEQLVEGQDGELLCTASVTYINGREISREVTSETMTIAPVTQIIAVGTGEVREEEAELVIGDGFIKLPTGEVLTYTRTDTVRATAYTHTDAGCDTITATGTTVHMGTVAVDPRFIPYGTRMFIVSNDGEYVYGLAVAEDCGGAIKRDRMDLYFPTYEECIQFGFRSCTIYFLG